MKTKLKTKLIPRQPNSINTVDGTTRFGYSYQRGGIFTPIGNTEYKTTETSGNNNLTRRFIPGTFDSYNASNYNQIESRGDFAADTPEQQQAKINYDSKFGSRSEQGLTNANKRKEGINLTERLAKEREEFANLIVSGNQDIIRSKYKTMKKDGNVFVLDTTGKYVIGELKTDSTTSKSGIARPVSAAVPVTLQIELANGKTGNHKFVFYAVVNNNGEFNLTTQKPSDNSGTQYPINMPNVIVPLDVWFAPKGGSKEKEASFIIEQVSSSPEIQKLKEMLVSRQKRVGDEEKLITMN
jgi:hypothetical protein